MKRFWKSATTEETADGWTVLLDGRPVRTPAKRQVVLPHEAMAQEVATEWDAQTEQVDPATMPMTRSAATCLDRVAPELDAVRQTIAAYGETDLLCYRADHPEALIARQAQAWDPVLAWAASRYDANLNTGAGVMHISQPATATQALAEAVHAEDAWPLTALADLTTISGSLVLALAVRHGHVDARAAWTASRIDEDWNIEQWGEDHDAAQQAARREADFLHAARVLGMLNDEPVP